VLNCAFDGDNIAVDTHVFRVSNRIGIIKASNVQVAEKALKKTVPKKWAKHTHHWLVLHGRYICKARNPACQDCFVNDLCGYYRNSGLK
jgi:endonuclease-3